MSVWVHEYVLVDCTHNGCLFVFSPKRGTFGKGAENEPTVRMRRRAKVERMFKIEKYEGKEMPKEGEGDRKRGRERKPKNTKH